MIKVTLIKDPKLKKLLKNLSKENQDRIRSIIAITLKDSTKARFFFQKDIHDRRFIQSAAAKREGRRTLIKTGNLQRSVDADVKGTTIEVGIPKATDYGKKFQLGIDGQDQREFLGLSAADRRIIMKIIKAELRL